MNIEFINEHPSFQFNLEDNFYDKTKSLFISEKVVKDISLCVVFMSDDDLLEINMKHLDHDYFTDIITFPIDETDDFLEADIYISIDRVKANANNYKVDSMRELLRVLLHGCLHLCGYNDHSKEEKRVMRAKEDFYLSF